MKIELDHETVDKVVRKALKEAYKYLGDNKHSVAIFDTDPLLNKGEVKRYRDALKLVHNWFAVPSDHI